VLFEVCACKIDILLSEGLSDDGDVLVDGILGLGGFSTAIYFLCFSVLAMRG
jgi:hypothetical protein